MSSLITVFGTITFPAGKLAVWRRERLTVEEEDVGEASVFDQANDLASVREVLADVDDCWPFMRLGIAGDALQVRAAMGDDDWARWCGRLRALVEAAGRLGARGQLVYEDEAAFEGKLVIRRGKAVYVPGGAAPADRVGAAEMSRLLDEAFAPKPRALRKKVAAKASPKTATKRAAKRVAAKASTGIATQTGSKRIAKGAAKKAVKRIAQGATRAKKSVRRG